MHAQNDGIDHDVEVDVTGSRDAFNPRPVLNPALRYKHFSVHIRLLKIYSEFRVEERVHGIFAHFGQSHESFWTKAQ